MRSGSFMKFYDSDPEFQKVTTVCGLCQAFASKSSAHGIPRIASSTDPPRKLLWTVVFLVALGGFAYHSIYLISNYLDYPRMTITEEIHATEIEFPAVTVCNLNPLKKSYFQDYLSEIQNSVEPTSTESSPGDAGEMPSFFGFPAYDAAMDYGSHEGICFRSVDDFVKKSKTMDLSDMWMSIIATRENLSKFGHQASELIAQCTYDARNCFNLRNEPETLEKIGDKWKPTEGSSQSGQDQPEYRRTSHSIVNVTNYPSPRYGLCHTIVVQQESLKKVRKTGTALGLRLTLNIERDEYLDLVSPEYGARLLIHPRGTFPTIHRGGVVLHPGSKTYVSVRMRKIERLPEPYRGCSESLKDSPLAAYLESYGLNFLLHHEVYTYEYCHTLCREAHMLKECGCLEELSNDRFRACDPCNTTQVICRSHFYRKYTKASGGLECLRLCEPACQDVRYDLTVSQSEWPNVGHQTYALKRWPGLNRRLAKPIMENSNSTNRTDDDLQIDLDYFRKNFLRVHIYIQEMNYLSVRDIPSYTLPELFADLGGCLGLYIGVSVITIVEIIEHMVGLCSFLYAKRKRNASATSTANERKQNGAAVSRRRIVVTRNVPTQFPEPYSVQKRDVSSQLKHYRAIFPHETSRRHR